ncbi:MAG TPA: hypothetical protein VKQ30_05415 [Ktedonobacterales bacterium]|nr:hypothetical protein [Ktedonobacterales bacterium]
MTPPLSKMTLAAPHQRSRPILAPLRQRWRLAASALVLLILLAAGLVALAYHQGFVVRGLAVDAATAFLTHVRHREYSAAYVLLAPDLTAHQTEQAFAAAMDAIRQTDGPVTDLAARELHNDGSLTVVGFDVTRSIRGGFSTHISLLQDTSGRWLVSGIDDL